MRTIDEIERDLWQAREAEGAKRRAAAEERAQDEAAKKAAEVAGRREPAPGILARPEGSEAQGLCARRLPGQPR